MTPVARNVWLPISRRDLGRPGAPLNHRIGVGLGQGIAGELAGRAAVGLEQQAPSDRSPAPRRRYTRANRLRDCDGTAWRAACRPSRASAPIAGGSADNVFDVHPDRRADAREGIDHQADQRAVAQTDHGRRVDRVDELPRLGWIEHRRLAAPHDMARPAHGGGRVGRHDLADHHPIEQMPQRRQAQLRGRRGTRLVKLLDIGGDMHAFDRRELRDAVRLKPIEKLVAARA